MKRDSPQHEKQCGDREMNCSDEDGTRQQSAEENS